MAKKFKLSIYTPKNTFFEKEVLELNIEIARGYIGILADHVPIISSIKTCRFSIKESSKRTNDGYIKSGILYFDKNILSVFASDIVWKDQVVKGEVVTKIEEIKEELSEKDITDYQKKRLEKILKYYQLQI